MGGWGGITHRWSWQTGETSLSALSRQTHDTTCPGQTLGPWGAVGTLREEERSDTKEEKRRTQKVRFKRMLMKETQVGDNAFYYSHSLFIPMAMECTH